MRPTLAALAAATLLVVAPRAWARPPQPATDPTGPASTGVPSERRTLAQESTAKDDGAEADRAAAVEEPDDLVFDPAQPDFTIVALPTTLRLPTGKSAFRVTHRFTRPLGQGDLGDLLEDFFGFDSGALIGLEYRFGLHAGMQIGIHRTSAKTIAIFGQHNVLRQDDRRAFGLDVLVTAEGPDNFRREYSGTLGVLFSRLVGDDGALYLEPLLVLNTNPLPDDLAEDNHTFVFGLGARYRIRQTVYLVAELAPRVGYAPGLLHGSFGIEKRVGGHAFQINFSDSFATTAAQIARGGPGGDNWYIGFNITRKFF